MRVTNVVRAQEPKSFPIEVKFLIESKEELQVLWHKLNNNPSNATLFASKNVDLPNWTGASPTYELWTEIDNLADDLGLRNDRKPQPNDVGEEDDDEDEDECDCPACLLRRKFFGKDESPKKNDKLTLEERLARMERNVNEIAKKMREAK